MNKINLSDESNKRSNRAGGIRNPGWMAFDLEQRRKQQGSSPNDSLDDYPALAGQYFKKSQLSKQGPYLDKPFSSVVGGVVGTQNSNQQKAAAVPVINSQLYTTGNVDPFQRIGVLHPWADKSFIQDVLAAVNGDVEEASRFLEEMIIGGKNHINTNFESDDRHGSTLPADGMVEMSCNSLGTVNDGYKTQEFLALPMLALNSFKSSIVEPELVWQQEDIYLLHRKDAIKMMRSASRLSKSANEAYLRGDHVAARHFSLKAQKQWNAARNLNAKAANEIINSRNLLNDIWRLDLHGLHATEAILALQQRLQIIESRDKATTSNVYQSESIASAVPPRIEYCENQAITSRLNPRSLQVITGKGNHSQGPAALPSTVKCFLSENGYHFDERPGMIVIRPKFRQQ